MPETSVADMVTVEPIHASEPILTQKSHIYGEVKVYPPNAAPSEWGGLSWLLTTEHDSEKNRPGLREILRADMVWAAFERPHFIDNRHRYLTS